MSKKSYYILRWKVVTFCVEYFITFFVDVTPFCGDSYYILRYASVNSSCAHAPPRANPRTLAFFSLGGQIPRGVGTLKLPNAPRWGRRKRANAPPPGSYVPNQHCSRFNSLHTMMPLSALNVWFFVSVGLPLRLLLFKMALSDVNKLNNAKHGILILHKQHYMIVDCYLNVWKQFASKQKSWHYKSHLLWIIWNNMRKYKTSIPIHMLLEFNNRSL